MSHKKKICNTALATHIEQCFDSYSYAPLLIHRGIEWSESDDPKGLRNIMEREISERQLAAQHAVAGRAVPEASIDDHLRTMFAKLAKDSGVELGVGDPGLSVMRDTVVSSLIRAQAVSDAAARAKIVADAGPELDLANPDRALTARIDRVMKEVKIDGLVKKRLEPGPALRARELQQLGIFFSEATCFECQGLAYTACGHETTLLPHESITEKQSSELTVVDTSSTNETAATDTTSTNRESADTTLVQSYDQTVRDTLNLKKSTKGTVGGKLFKLLDVSLESNSALDFTHFVERINKSSSTIKQELMREVVSKFTLTRTRSQSLTTTTTQNSSFDRSINNPGDTPLHFIEREAHCVYTVALKRTGAFLGWSGCIDRPGKDLCSDDNFEEMHSNQIAAIKDRWQHTPPPQSFGPRPANVRICSEVGEEDSPGTFGNDTTEITHSTQIAIPAGYGYVAGSATVVVVDSDTAVSTSEITSQPGAGASGLVNFGVRVVMENKVFNTEWVKFKVCFDATTPESAEYDASVTAWRNQQTETEIAALRAAENAKLNEFLLSERLGPIIVRNIMQKYFGVDATANCCSLFKHVQSIFDFDKLGFELLPSWNATGSGCSLTDPVTLANAKCLNFYAPVRPGNEWEALGLLRAINVIPNSPSLISQIGGYINAIIAMRTDLFGPAFDPTGMESIVDGPNGYILTPYDVGSNDWNMPFEATSPKEQLIDLQVVTVPCGTERREFRPDIC